ncbi:hypothetical protein [Rubricoccus marinus]|uniref:Uncharacterized protein n=1 Tax=Rubricoccus marinus TaxID=716817 RepID=A0A259U1F7_9BACT|nr:hypothetical protein [Rubricoccus marinus]OZC03822.1 hypothetical protein BSZ36_12995 [Rubricoccus marinus]
MLRFAPVLLLAAAACSYFDGSASLPIGADGRVANQTAEAIHVFAVDAETATLIDIAPEFDITDQRVVPPGETAPFDIDGYERGEDIVVFVYRVTDGHATYATTLAASARGFEQNGETVTVRSL